jgi:hypothetical protein
MMKKEQTKKEKEEKVCCVCGGKATSSCGHCQNLYCDKHYGTTVMTGNCCSGNEKDYE